jgi:nicotinate-nucleotide pyrophosphorylase (carboxylating)
MFNDCKWKKIDLIIDNALNEDLGQEGDVTSSSILSDTVNGEANLIVQEHGIIAGLPVFCRVIYKVDSKLSISLDVKDGDRVKSGMSLGKIRGNIKSILSAERTALNFLQHLSGIATLTSQFVDAVQGTGVKILDTRKTIPQFRFLQKYAVTQGGGENHRFGLFDMVLIKENHIAAAGNIGAAIENCLNLLKERNLQYKIEVEVRTLQEVREAIRFPVNRIMLDNMDPDTIQKSVREINNRVEVEVSGGVSLNNVRTIAKLGIDYVSVGALTHSANALDITLIVNMI